MRRVGSKSSTRKTAGRCRWSSCTTTHSVKFVTDNAGRVAFDLPELMGQETWFTVFSDGYEVPADGFGYRGVRVTPKPGETAHDRSKSHEHRQAIGASHRRGIVCAKVRSWGSKRIGRKAACLGCDSVQNAVHNGRMFWAWGDTTLARYPLGIFDMTSATTAIRPLEKFEPPLRVKLDYFRRCEWPAARRGEDAGRRADVAHRLR